jgi:hypothetical protein
MGLLFGVVGTDSLLDIAVMGLLLVIIVAAPLLDVIGVTPLLDSVGKTSFMGKASLFETVVSTFFEFFEFFEFIVHPAFVLHITNRPSHIGFNGWDGHVQEVIATTLCV